MRKKLIAILLVVIMLTSTAGAYTASQVRTADAMNSLGLFLGTSYGYELDSSLTRAQGITLLVRMIGQEEAATTRTYQIPFTDVPSWAAGYVGYAYTNKITNGISATKFNTYGSMTDYMFLTLTLRALGYTDSGADAQFVWNDPYKLANEVGLIDSVSPDNNFTRGEAIQVFWNAMNAKLADGNQTLAESLIAQGVFTKAQFAEAQNIQKNGRTENAGVPLVPGTNTPAVDPDVGSSDPDGGTDSAGSDKKLTDYTYEEYTAMSGEEQQEFFNSFDSPADFFEWYNAAKAEYEASQEKIEIGDDGSIDLGDLINGNS